MTRNFMSQDYVPELEQTTVRFPVADFDSNGLTAWQKDHMPQSITKHKYATNIDPRGYLTTFQYEIPGSTQVLICWDFHTGLVFYTGIWRLLKIFYDDTNERLPSINWTQMFSDEVTLKRIRGGFIKIQGTWMEYEMAYKTCCINCYPIRHLLVPIFGSKFLEDVLPPDDPNYNVYKGRRPAIPAGTALASRQGKKSAKDEEMIEACVALASLKARTKYPGLVTPPASSKSSFSGESSKRQPTRLGNKMDLSVLLN